jgi:Xaa-Pro aminopeptidase
MADQTTVGVADPLGSEAIAEQLERRRRATAAAWDLSDEVVLIGAGEVVPLPGRGDLTYPFLAHSEYFYLTDRQRPGGVLAFDPQTGWVDFVEPVSSQELLWTGTEGAREGVPEGAASMDELAAWIQERSGRRTGCLGARIAGIASDASFDNDLRYTLTDVRRVKDAVELTRMRIAEGATRAGFADLVSLLSPGKTERELQIELEVGFLRGGADRLAFDTIVAGGLHSAVLHFAPTERQIREGELVLVDAGGECRGYDSDVTRTYGASGSLNPEQRDLYSLVRAAGVAATERCTRGTEWKEVHRTAARVIGEGLVELDILRGNVDSLIERGTVSLFFPHGIGHMVGLGVRDAGGALRGRGESDPGSPSLRVDLPLQPGYTMTVEPGIYFVPALLENSANREQHSDAVAWDRVDRLRGFGGIRIEDNVLITDDNPEILTADIPVPYL